MRRPSGSPGGRVEDTAALAKIAERIVAAYDVVDTSLPSGLAAISPLNILLQIYIAEGHALYLTAGGLCRPADTSVFTVEKWLDVLEAEGLIDQKNGLIALTQMGYETVVKTLSDIEERQRSLD